MTTLSALTPRQREQAATLFFDEIFGTNPDDFEYELNGDDVAGRKRLHATNETPRKPRHVDVTMSVMDAPNVTDGQIRAMEIVYQSMARRIVQRLVSQTVEA